MYDILIRGGRVVDGTGAPAYPADVAIEGGRIAAIGANLAGEAKRTVQAEGRVVAARVEQGPAARRLIPVLVALRHARQRALLAFLEHAEARFVGLLDGDHDQRRRFARVGGKRFVAIGLTLWLFFRKPESDDDKQEPAKRCAVSRTVGGTVAIQSRP